MIYCLWVCGLSRAINGVLLKHWKFIPCSKLRALPSFFMQKSCQFGSAGRSLPLRPVFQTFLGLPVFYIAKLAQILHGHFLKLPLARFLQGWALAGSGKENFFYFFIENPLTGSLLCGIL